MTFDFRACLGMVMTENRFSHRLPLYRISHNFLIFSKKTKTTEVPSACNGTRPGYCTGVLVFFFDR